MRTVAITMGGVCALLSSLVVVGSSARAADVPSYFKEIVGTQSATPGEIGNKNILQLNTTMFELYGDAGQMFKKNILAQHPLILGLFTGAGGRFILYRPGMEPVDAPSVPLVYQLLKSVGHSTMALAEVVIPYLNSPNDLTWRASLAAYRNRMQSALDGLDAASMQDDWRPTARSILQADIPGPGWSAHASGLQSCSAASPSRSCSRPAAPRQTTSRCSVRRASRRAAWWCRRSSTRPCGRRRWCWSGAGSRSPGRR